MNIIYNDPCNRAAVNTRRLLVSRRWLPCINKQAIELGIHDSNVVIKCCNMLVLWHESAMRRKKLPSTENDASLNSYSSKKNMTPRETGSAGTR